jgi:hypothetical protein
MLPGWLTIECTDANVPDYPAPLDADKLAQQIDNAVQLFNAASR